MKKKNWIKLLHGSIGTYRGQNENSDYVSIMVKMDSKEITNIKIQKFLLKVKKSSSFVKHA